MGRIRKTDSRDQVSGKEILWKIALYARLSRDDGNDESLSVVNQKKLLAEFVEKTFIGDHVVVDTYVDDGRTGTDYDRPEFQRMLRDVENKKVNCIVCKNLARAFRNYSDQGYFLESYFPQRGIRFITLGEPKVDSYLNPEAVSGLEVPINGLMNDRFAYATSCGVRRTLDVKRRNGEFIGAFAPYGYRKDPSRKNALAIDEEAARIVRDIFHWFVYGDGTSEGSLGKESIARKLNGMGIPNPTLYKKKKGLPYHNPGAKDNDGLWIGATITRMLKNKVYVGTMVQGRQRVVSYKVHDVVNLPEEEWFQVADTHPPVVSQELFDLAQKLHAKDIRAAPDQKGGYLFSGFLRCADCRKSMTRRPVGRFVYYHCSTYRRKSKERCTKHTIRLDILESALLLVLQKQIELIKALDQIIDTINRAPSENAKTGRIEQLLSLRTQELAKTKGMIENVYIDWRSGEITEEQYRGIKDRLTKQEERIKKSIRLLKEETSPNGSETSPGNPFLHSFLANRNVRALSQGALAELVEVVHIHEGRTFAVFFRFVDPCAEMFCINK